MKELFLAIAGIALGYAFRWIYDVMPMKPRFRVSFGYSHGKPSSVVVENNGTRPFTVVSVSDSYGLHLSTSGVIVHPHESATFTSNFNFHLVYVHIAGMKPVRCLPSDNDENDLD